MKTDLYPLLLIPVYKDYVWGGGRIPAFFGRPPRAGTSAESWEVSDRPEGMSVVANGPLAGRTLHDLAGALGPALLGRESSGNRLPVLIKIIDANRCLSVQVHPDDRSAAQHGGEAKTEMWYVLDAAPGARVYAGLAPGTSREAFLKAVARGGIEQTLQAIPLRKGDAVFVPGGRVHAIDAGCLLLEIQQNSNTTYRVYDWSRVGADGKARSLHLSEALRVIDWSDVGPAPVRPRPLSRQGRSSLWQVVACPCFNVRRIDLRETMALSNDGPSFHALFVAAGRVRVTGGSSAVDIGAGMSCLLAAAIDRYALDPASGEAEVILTSAV